MSRARSNTTKGGSKPKPKPTGEKGEKTKKEREEKETKILDQFARVLMSVRVLMPL